MTVHTGGKHYHSDQSGVPGCPQVQWRTETEEMSEEEARAAGYDRCSRCF